MKKFLPALLIAALFISSCSKKSQPTPAPATQTVTVTTFAGGGTGNATNGLDSVASFNGPSGLAIDSSGNVYVADYENGVRKITASGLVSSLGSTTTAGCEAVAVSPDGNVYVTIPNFNKVSVIAPSGSVTTLAGSPAIKTPYGIAVSADGSDKLYVTNAYNMISNVTSSGVVTTFAGGGPGDSTNAVGTAASFKFLQGMAIDKAGNLYVADFEYNVIRKITPAGLVSTLAGGGTGTATNGTGTAASFSYPTGVAVDAAGNVYVADLGNRLIRKITAAGVVTTLAGVAGVSGLVNGPGAKAEFERPWGIAVDAKGENIYVSENEVSGITTGAIVIRKITISE